MPDTTRKKALLLFLILTKPFNGFLNLQGNSIYVLPDIIGLKTKILTYSASTDSIIHPDPLFKC